MVMIKGVNLSSTLKNNKELFGEETFNKLIGLLSSEDQKVLAGTILDAEWYPLDSYSRYLDVMVKEALGGNIDALRKGAAAVIEIQFKGIYKAMLMLGSPEAFVERISQITARYLQGITIETNYLEKKKVNARLYGLETKHKHYAVTILGWWDKSLEMLGGKNVKVDVITSIDENKGYYEFVASWE